LDGWETGATPDPGVPADRVDPDPDTESPVPRCPAAAPASLDLDSPEDVADCCQYPVDFRAIPDPVEAAAPAAAPEDPDLASVHQFHRSG